ncbi:hypothetical protein IOD16_13035 [Saccharothrix sp. 6-C]|nr:hypothetical protein [Saccharothrix sp. 6-C]QQQ79260.1 hypothetical protein IOD16_13035 [Saccharothrix sp. 6-C]
MTTPEPDPAAADEPDLADEQAGSANTTPDESTPDGTAGAGGMDPD